MLEQIENIKIDSMIYEIRGKQVILDSDLAKLYQCKNGTKEINQAVNRNTNKFPDSFSWKLNKNEIDILRSQSVTTNKFNSMSRSNPRVFTEQGVAMLTTILKSDVAVEVSIKIMDAFVAMRHYISQDLLTNNIEHKLLDHDNRIGLLESTFNNFKEKNNHIFFEGQIYDAYSLLLDIFNKSKKEIIIIDNYANKEILDIISKLDRNVTIVSTNMDEVLIKKYMNQYSNLTIINNNSFHDRFIIIDKCILYHSGSSLKDLGKKCFALNKIEDNNYLKIILREIYDNI